MGYPISLFLFPIYRINTGVNESIILIRGAEGEIHGHYNVCCHPGSRICLQQQGKTNLMVCPYHSWSYRADGSLANAPYMPADFDPSTVALKSCHVRLCEGLIFICLADEPQTLMHIWQELILIFSCTAQHSKL